MPKAMIFNIPMELVNGMPYVTVDTHFEVGNLITLGSSEFEVESVSTTDPKALQYAYVKPHIRQTDIEYQYDPYDPAKDLATWRCEECRELTAGSMATKTCIHCGHDKLKLLG